MNAACPAAPAAPARRHLAVLDALRFACAVAVLGYHVGMVAPLAVSSATRLFGTVALPADAARWTAWGWIGVEIFFVLSGHAIAMSIGVVDRPAFARARLLRLLPAGAICATLTALILAGSGALPAGEVMRRWLATLTMLPFGARIDGVWWTLQVEVMFYLAVAATLRGDLRDHGRVERLGHALALWSGLYWLVLLLTDTTTDVIETPLRFLLLPHGGLFALGIALSALGRGVTRARLGWTGVALAVSLAEVATRATLADGAGGVASPPAIPILVFLAALGLLASARALDPHLRARRLLARLGRITYPLYLLNQVVGAAIIVALIRIGASPPLAMIATVVAVVALSDAIVRSAEPALRRRLDALFSRSRAPRPDTPPTASLPAG